MGECKILVLDEADKLLSQDFKGMLDHVISRCVCTEHKKHLYLIYLKIDNVLQYAAQLFK